MRLIKVIYFWSFCCIYFQACGQSEKKIPLFIETINKERIIVFDNDVRDSLKIFFQAVVNFEHPLNDSLRKPIVDSVEVLRMSARLVRDKLQIINFGYNNEVGNAYQKYIWNLCVKKINYWLINQPYNQMNKKNKLNRSVFGGVFYIFPAKSAK